jgi:hypothetical protein
MTSKVRFSLHIPALVLLTFAVLFLPVPGQAVLPDSRPILFVVIHV